MGILSTSPAAAFDNVTVATGAASATASNSVTLTFSPVGLKTVYSLKLNGSFDASFNIQNLTSAFYITPDGSVFNFSFPFLQPSTAFNLTASVVRSDRLWEVILSGDDVLTLGDLADNVNLFAGDDYVDAGAGNDLMTGGAGNDVLYGGAGIDTAVFSGNRANFSLAPSGGNYVVTDRSGVEGTDTLVSVERVRFADTNVAIDMSGAAGTTAKTLGAVFGKAAVANKEYVGIGLNLLDGGMSYLDLMQAAINAKLGAGASNATVVNLLYTNVVGTPPPAGDLAYFTGLLDSRAYTQASLGVLAADTVLNAANVNLVGLANSGLEYLPQG